VSEFDIAVSDLQIIVTQRASALHVTGMRVLVRDFRTTTCSAKPNVNHPTCAKNDTSTSTDTFTTGTATGGEPSSEVSAVLFTGSASGRFFGLSLDHFGALFFGPGDSLVTVNATYAAKAAGAGVGGGIHLYQLSAEHLPTDYQVQVWRSSAGTHLHAFKFESAGTLAHPTWEPNGGGLLACHASSNVTVFGGSGNYGVMNTTLASNIIFAWGCDDMRVNALVRKPQDGEVPPARANWVHAVGGGNSSKTLVIDDHAPDLLAFSL
jgi:hypothetical protein